MKEKKIMCGSNILKDNSVTVAVHSCAHSLNHCFEMFEDSFHVFRMLLKNS